MTTSVKSLTPGHRESARRHRHSSLLAVVLCLLPLAACSATASTTGQQAGAGQYSPPPAAVSGPSEAAPPVAKTQLTIDGLWKSTSGTVISLQNGVASPSLFGFDGGPSGTYQLSGQKPDGSYELYGSHVTGGSVDYIVTARDSSHITLKLQGQPSFAPSQLQLSRQ